MASFRGYFLPEKRNSNGDGEDSEVESESDNEDFENPDYHDIVNTTCGRYKFYNPSRTRYVTERLRELKELDGRLQPKGEKLVRARFDRMFTHPWWMAEMIMKGSSQTQKSIPSYSIRSDDGVNKSLISLFLTQGCRVQEQHAFAILDFFENRNLRTTFDCLSENITEFERSSDIDNDIVKQIRKSLTSTATGKAFLVPELTKIAHRLFPHHTDALFSSTSLEVLKCIEQAVRNEPWILGYQKVLQGKFGISGCEAKLAAFIDCGLLTAMPVVKRDALYIYNALCKLTYKEGHTFVPLCLLKCGRWYNKPVAPGPYQVTKWDESLTYLLEIHAVGISGNTFEDECSVFLPHIHGYEKSIVRDICTVRNGMPWVNYMEIDEKLFNGDQDQIRAAHLITQKPVVVLSGRGGCGKTHVVSTVLSKVLELEESQMSGDQCDHQETSGKLQPSESILLTAPTGRAASILGKRTGIEAYTLHSVIFSYFHWLKEVKEKQNESTWKFSDVNLLVCDECSLISVKSFSTLLNILLKKTALQQIILLGDVNQLPSIEPGNFLSDVYHALEQNDCAITLRTNHRAESQLIVENARRISQQEMPIFPDDCKKGFISLPYQSRKTKNGQESDGFRETEIVKDLLNNKISAVPSLEPRNSQFITFRRLDCLKINELCCKHYENHSLKTPEGKMISELVIKYASERTRSALMLARRLK
ncbi:DNA helicase B-like [Stylophora pistillata]|uniref:DNA helicase B-like n=1 Tax=Stylophora pistillata TaxID=50429 RepID=UPI000C04F147|nr:DNA helicase B-like [Stylophora pistillata]